MASRGGFASAFGAGLAAVGGALLLGALIDGLSKPTVRREQPRPSDDEMLRLARSQLAQAARLLGVPAPPVEWQRSGNASSDGRVIRVNPAFFREVLAAFCDHHLCQLVVVLGIMAHELGHHLLRHAAQYDNSVSAAHQRELEADGVAGQVLALARVAPDDFERVLAYFGRQETATHPHGMLRTTQVRASYEQTRLA